MKAVLLLLMFGPVFIQCASLGKLQVVGGAVEGERGPHGIKIN